MSGLRFAAQQAAEKTVKGLVLRHGGEPWGHSVTHLVEALRERILVGEEILEAARGLDKHYIPDRYPNGYERGAPVDYYTRGEAEAALADAELILRFARDSLG